jgi:acyl-CoA reductase-like NAD-dependent aldehyde dehydrogenase
VANHTDQTALTEWIARAAALRPDLRPFIGGQRCPSHGQDTIASINPATGQELWQVPAGDARDIDDAVAAANVAFNEGSWTRDPALRQATLLRLATLLEESTDELALLDTLEIGIPIGVTTDDATAAAQIVRDIVAMLPDVSDDVEAPARRVPRGVVAVIAPWNFPFFVALTKTVPVLAVGNTVVLKPSELASASALLLADLAIQAGFPAGVFNVVPGRGNVAGDALVRHRLVNQVNFTGSLLTGRAVVRATAETSLAPVLTELGGKSAHVVGELAPDLEVIADAVAANIFWCAGQVCSSGSRLIVHERHHDALVELLAERVAEWQPGDPLDPAHRAGPLGSQQHVESVDRMVQHAVGEGGRVVAGAKRGSGPGSYYEPTIIAEVTPAHRLFNEEVFGPVLAVTSCRSTAEGIELANATEYGLVATGWSDDPDEMIQLADGLRAGWVTVNPHRDPPSNPRVGAESIGASGSGVEGGVAALRAATRLVVVSVGSAEPSSEGAAAS